MTTTSSIETKAQPPSASRDQRILHWIGRGQPDCYSGSGRVGMPAKMILDAGVRWVRRVVGTRNGSPLLEDRQLLDVQTVIWATGYRPDYR